MPKANKHIKGYDNDVNIVSSSVGESVVIEFVGYEDGEEYTASVYVDWWTLAALIDETLTAIARREAFTDNLRSRLGG